jgi:hypothetical protein
MCSWKLCLSGSSNKQPTVLGVTPDSHVTQRSKGMANAGAATATGVVPGVRPDQPDDSNAVAGEWSLSRKPDELLAGASGEAGRCARQGSRDPLCADRWCWAQSTTKGLTDNVASGSCLAAGVRPRCRWADPFEGGGDPWMEEAVKRDRFGRTMSFGSD